MSVEKINFSSIKQSSKPFTTHFNSVLQNLHDVTALGIWCYLSSLPSGWKINKKQLRVQFGIGRDKLDSALAHLRAHNLLEIGRERRKNGTLGDSFMEVKCGYDFKTDNKDVQINQSTENQSTGKPDPGFPTPIKETILEKKIDIKKEDQKLLSATGVARSNSDQFFFDEFWKIYPRKRNRDRALKIWKKKKYDEIARLILDDVRNRLMNDSDWQDDQYIPHPATYLANRRFEDEITLVRKKPKKESTLEQAVRMCLN